MEDEYTRDREPNRRPSLAVVHAVADSTRRPPLELTPLAEAIDPDALDDLFFNGDSAALVSVVFEYEGRRVEITPDRVRVVPTDG